MRPQNPQKKRQPPPKVPDTPEIDAADRPLNGEALDYHDSGAIKTKAYFRNGLLTKKVLSYSEARLNFQDSAYDNDLLNGLTTILDDDGRLMMRAWFVNGKLQGPMEIYEEGILQARFMYARGGREGEAVLYNIKTGKVSGIEHYHADKRHGRAKYYDDEGRLVSEIDYRNGKVDGEKIDYYPSGAIMQRASFHKDVMHGEMVGFFENGNPREKKRFEYGSQVGETVSFHKNWKKKRAEEYLRFHG